MGHAGVIGKAFVFLPSAWVEGCRPRAGQAGRGGSVSEEPAAALPAGTSGAPPKDLSPSNVLVPDLLSRKGTKFPVALPQEAAFPFGEGTQ